MNTVRLDRNKWTFFDDRQNYLRDVAWQSVSDIRPAEAPSA